MDDVKSVLITADSRESKSGVTLALSKFKGVTVNTADLLSGDYAIGDGVGVERKSANDLAASIMSSHIFGQIELMKAEYEKSILLIEGDIYNTRSAIPEVALDGFLSFVAMLTNVKLVYTRSAEHSASMIYRLALHNQHGLGYIPPMRSGKPKDLYPLALYAIEGLPSVGATTARALLNHFKSPLNVFNATKEQLSEVKGVGPKMIDKIHDVLHMRQK